MNAMLLKEVEPGRLYSSSALRAARHFWTVDEDARATDLADALQDRPEILVVTVLAPDGRAVGIIPRDRLFAMLSKSYGREILGKMRVSELVEEAPAFDAHAGIFTVAQETLGAGASSRAPFHILIDGDGRFKGTLSSQDLADYLSRITQDDIDLAGKLQDRLQAGNESIGGSAWRFEAWSRAAKGVGGDFYFTRTLADGNSFFCLCDVSGKGVAASLVVAMVWGMLRMYDFGGGLRSLVMRLNESIVGTFHLEKYLTGYFAVFDPAARELLVADMGHSHCFLFRGESVLVPRSERSNLPIGVEMVIDPAIVRWPLEAGDRLFVFSDGLSEQEDGAGAEFGERRLIEAVRRNRGSGEPLGEALSRQIDEHRGRTPQQDDMSFVLLSLEGGGPSRPRVDRLMQN